jgi:phosphatidylserine/phosphatidylglycerophosphate/cardiolipin synthase-like enzyme
MRLSPDITHPLQRAPEREGNRFRLLGTASEFFPRMLEAIERSERYVLAEFYLAVSGRIADQFITALGGAARRGVRVYVLLDGFGARRLAEPDRARLRASGVQLVVFNAISWRGFPRQFVRDHRKLLLIDGLVGFTGGAGLMDAFDPVGEQLVPWHDCMIEIAGPVLEDWQRLFARTWRRSARNPLEVPELHCVPLVPGERGRVAASAGLETKDLGSAVIRRVRRARTRVWIATAYFWPSQRLRRALRQAAERGVDVRLVLTGTHTDAPALRSVSRLFYGRLLASGVVIYEFQPGFLHTKIVLADEWVSIGSCNLDRWGTLWNLEANQEVSSPQFAHQVSLALEQTLSHSVAFRDPGEIESGWSARFWRLIGRAALAWSGRVVAKLRERRR